MKAKTIKFIAFISLLIAFCLIILIGPANYFRHGFYTSPVDVSKIPQEDYLNTIPLSKEEYKVSFTPYNKLFAGFEIFLKNNPEGNTGKILLTLMNKDVVIDKAEADLNEITDSRWHEIKLNKTLKVGCVYTLAFSVQGCATYPSLQKVKHQYVQPESGADNNILLSYAYQHSTFSFQTKILLCLYVISFLLLLYSVILSQFKIINNKYILLILKNKKIFYFPVLSIMTIVLAWNYMYNTMDIKNTGFPYFQSDSEALVRGPIYAQKHGIWYDEETSKKHFGLGLYYDAFKGGINLTYNNPITDSSYLDGYAIDGNSVELIDNHYTNDVAALGNYVRFSNGEELQISGVTKTKSDSAGAALILTFNTDHIISKDYLGPIQDIRFLDVNKNELKYAELIGYGSQFGLQGKIFRYIAMYLDDGNYLEDLHLLCSLLTAIFFVIFVYLIYKKYNILLAVCFYITFWLSPWIVNFARNLYWVEFTWFLPIIAGLICSLVVDNRNKRFFCYILVFVSVFIKSLCGYEYISTIMLGTITFLASDFFVEIFNKDKKRAFTLFKTLLFISIFALFGFISALCMHGYYRCDGSVIDGIKSIYVNDVLRRTFGGSITYFDHSLLDSLNASAWDVLCKYYKFSTQIIVGVDANIFPFICVTSIISLILNSYYNKNINIKLLSLYFMFYLMPISWYILAKSHSYIHLHMNYVLWYTGYIQICFYSILLLMGQIIKLIHNGRSFKDRKISSL